MIGAIAGDLIGSIYEHNNVKTTDFALFKPESTFTDDSVLTVAVADSLLQDACVANKLKEYYNLYPKAGYGSGFTGWASGPSNEPYNSWGNGSAMRVSPVGFAFNTLDEVLEKAEKSAAVTHNHIEGIKGAQAVAACIFLARTGKSKHCISDYIQQQFSYRLDEPLDSIREHYQFDPSCQGTVPQAITAFLESENYEDAIRKAVSIGGDSDTIACMTGGIAQAFYKDIPDSIQDKVYEILDSRLRQVMTLFCNRYSCH